MSNRSPRTPSYRLHKPTGQAVVTLDGRDFYLGKHGSPESRAEYDRLVAEWLANGRRLVGHRDITVAELVVAYVRFAETHYRRDGVVGREVGNIKDALRPVRKLYGHTPAAEFGPAAYKAVRATMIEAGLARSTVNNRLGKVRRVWRWGVECELLPADAYHRLQAVAPLRKGRDDVREAEPVTPVPEEHLHAILPYVRPPIRAMLLLMLYTGARPGEIQRMTTGQVDRSCDPWVYAPARHKNDGRGKSREILIGPKGQAILRGWLKAAPDAPLFSPAEDAVARHAERAVARRTKRTPSEQRRRREPRPKRTPGRWYSKNAFADAVRRACQQAGVPEFSPNQVRHLVATEVRRRFGLEGAQLILGHSKADTTQLYAERDASRAREIALTVG